MCGQPSGCRLARGEAPCSGAPNGSSPRTPVACHGRMIYERYYGMSGGQSAMWLRLGRGRQSADGRRAGGQIASRRPGGTMGLAKVPSMKRCWSAPFTLREMVPCAQATGPAGSTVAVFLSPRHTVCRASVGPLQQYDGQCCRQPSDCTWTCLVPQRSIQSHKRPRRTDAGPRRETPVSRPPHPARSAGLAEMAQAGCLPAGDHRRYRVGALVHAASTGGFI